MRINLSIADFTNTTKETTTMITAKVNNAATFNPVTNLLRERKIAKLVNELTKCTSLEQEMPLRRELTALYAVNDIALARK